MTTSGNPRLGALFTIAAVMVFGFQDGISKLLAQQYHVFFVITVRYWAFVLVLLSIYASRRGGLRRVAATKCPVRQFLRGALLAVQVCMIVQSFAASACRRRMPCFRRSRCWSRSAVGCSWARRLVRRDSLRSR